jgi:hypothetical protein
MHDLFGAGGHLPPPTPSSPADGWMLRPKRAGSRGIRIILLAAFVLIVAAACDDSSKATGAQDDTDNCFAEGWEECEQEPYPFSSPAPPVVSTAVDGTYTRNISEQLAWAPGKCRRCPPYRLEPGRETLVFDSGRFFVSHHPPGFRSKGHFTESDHQVVLFNDANCIGFEGIYNWRIENGRLYLDAVEDECPFTNLRQRFLMAKAWNVDQAD